MISLMFFAWFTAVLATLALAQATPERPQDLTGAIRGRVTASDTRVPLPRVRVVLASERLPAPRVVLTDEAGTYSIERLPAGVYSVRFSRTGYVTEEVRASVDAAAPRQVTELDAVLQPAAVIRGRILDEDGSPLEGAVVQALLEGVEADRPGLTPAAAATTDDLGQFRLSGLEAGRYIVAAIDRAFERAGDAQGAANYPATYYPGVSTPEAAVAVRAAARGNELQRIEFRLRIVRPVAISGHLRSRDNRPLLSAVVVISPVLDTHTVDRATGRARIEPDGRFTFTSVAPGRYMIRARGETERDGASLFAVYAVTVQERDVTGVDLTLTSGAAIEGQVTIRPKHGHPAPAPTALRVRAPFSDGSSFGDTLTGSVRADGSFRLSGLAAGPHVLMVEGLTFPWRIAEAQLQGRDVTESPFDVGPDQVIRSARVLLTDTAAAVAGTITASRTPAGDVLVVAFPVDALRRRVPLRFVRVARAAADGSYRLGDLVPGSYLVVAALDVSERDVMNPATLERLVPHATPVTLAEAQVSTVALQPKAAPPPSLP